MMMMMKKKKMKNSSSKFIFKSVHYLTYHKKCRPRWDFTVILENTCQPNMVHCSADKQRTATGNVTQVSVAEEIRCNRALMVGVLGYIYLS